MITVRVVGQGVADILKVPNLPMLVAPVNHQTAIWTRLAISQPPNCKIGQIGDNDQVKVHFTPICHCKRQQLQVVERGAMTTILFTLALFYLIRNFQIYL